MRRMSEKERAERDAKAFIRGEELVSIMNDLLGIDIREPNRRRILCAARAIIAMQMIDEKFSYKEIGYTLRRDRTDILYLEKKAMVMRSFLVYEDEEELYKNFMARL